MKRIISIFWALILAASVNNNLEAQTLMQAANKAEKRAIELKQQEMSRYNAILESRDLDKYNQFIADYPKSKNSQEIRNRAEELKLWKEAKSTSTIEGYEKYLNNTKYHWYDKDANNTIRLLRQQAEKQEWDKVVAVNTIDAYENYLHNNPKSGYRQDAEKAINRLKGALEWQKIKDTNNIAELQSYISSFPQAAEVKTATLRLHELKGVKYYNEGNLVLAYTEFSQISKDKISYANRKAYDDVMEYNEFTKLEKYPTESSLQAFMRQYPYSKYYDKVSNMLAISKAMKFGDHASSYDYDQALSYAKDSYTRNSVESYISINKKKQRDRIKAIKSWERRQNGGTFNLGLEFLDAGFNRADDDCTFWYYNLGLVLRFGNFKDRVQFACGLKPGVFGYDQKVYNRYYDNFESKTKTEFHMPIVGQLKLNLFNTSKNSRFFLFGKYQYNAIRVENIETEMSWGAGCGIAWKHVDWSLYYQKDIGNVDNKKYPNQHFFGMSLIYYWKL